MDEFMINLIGSIMISTIVTAFTYGFGPVTVALFWGKPIQKKRFKTFCIIYTVIVWFSWQMYRVSSGDNTSIMPAILWGYISYLVANRIMGKKHVEEQTPKAEKLEPVVAEPEPPAEEPKKEQEIQRWYTCPKCGQLVKDGEECDCEAVKLALEEEKKKKEEQKQQKRQALKKALPLYAVCVVLLVAVCALGFYSYNLKGQVDELSAKNKELSEKNEKLSTENKERLQSIYEISNEKSKLEKEYSDFLDDYINDIELTHFYYNQIGLIVNGSNRYHRFDCPIFQEADEYWAHNIDYCEYLGYSKCKDCW